VEAAIQMPAADMSVVVLAVAQLRAAVTLAEVLAVAQLRAAVILAEVLVVVQLRAGAILAGIHLTLESAKAVVQVVVRFQYPTSAPVLKTCFSNKALSGENGFRHHRVRRSRSGFLGLEAPGRRVAG
jgi:hypothetical protein